MDDDHDGVDADHLSVVGDHLNQVDNLNDPAGNGTDAQNLDAIVE
jgi:hypothetical protein